MLSHDWSQSLGAYFGEFLGIALLWALIFSIIGFLFAAGISFVLHKKKLLKRHLRAWNIAAKFIYPLILIALPMMGGAFGSVYGAKRFTHQVLDQQVLPALSTQMPLLRKYLATQAKTYKLDQMITARDLIEPMVKDLYYVPKSDNAWERAKVRWINDKILHHAADVFSFVLEKALIGMIDTYGDALKKDFRGQAASELTQMSVDMVVRVTSDFAKEVDFTRLDSSLPQIFVDALKQQFDSYIKSLYISIDIMALVLMLLVAGEILIYHHYHRQKLDSLAIEEKSNLANG
jgi:hypothetical protein